jgi:cellulose synthase/poly-beta-1,6-N-acetylglucosamine synthase-like glycosyltransferase
MHALFWIALGLLSFSYVGYPLLLFVISRRASGSAGTAGPQLPSRAPRVAVVLSAFNEQVHIGARIENLRAQTYPRERVAIYVGSDGSTDLTLPILQQLQAPDLHVFGFTTRRGKASVLNDLLTHVQEPVCIFTDANVVFEQDAIERLVGSLYEHEAGAVVGELQLQKSAGDNQDSLYWRIERMLKAAEGRMGALLGANGAIYAIRSELYEPLPPDTIIDDFVIAMRIASRGHALVYESAARAIEDTPDNIDDEFRRRVRIGIGNYQALFRFPQFLFNVSPQRGLCYLSHKILRWLGPHLLLVMLIASLLSYGQPLYRMLFWAQLLGYGMLLGVNALRARVRLPRWLGGLLLLAGLNLAFAVAFWRYLCNDMQGQWSRTQRRVSH